MRVLDEALALAKNIGYPVVLKPNEGVGAQGVFKVRSDDEMRTFFPRVDREYVIEKFLPHPIVTFDGLTDADGHVIFENSLVYGSGVLDNVLGSDTFFYVARHIPHRLSSIGHSLVEAFGIKRKFFHFELFYAHGDYIPVEINARPPGGAIIDMMNYSVDQDLYSAYAKMIAQGPQKTSSAKSEKKYFVGFAGRKDRPYRHGHREIVERLGPALVEFGENPPLYWTGMGRYRYIYRCPEEKTVEEFRDFILETV